MIGRFTRVSQRPAIGWLAVGLLGAMALLAWLNYRAVTEWRQSAALLAQRRADEAVDLLATAISRDMRGVHTSVLPSLQFGATTSSMTLDLHALSAAFAKYPYPEAFFTYRQDQAAGSVTFYGRTERPAAWLPPDGAPARFPVRLARGDSVGRLLQKRIGRDAMQGRQLSTFDLTLHETRYQVVASLAYSDSLKEGLSAVVGFLVNMDWVHDNYFPELAEQVRRMRGADSGLTFAALDGDGKAGAGNRSNDVEAPSGSRDLPLLFFDPNRMALESPDDLRQDSLTVRATVAGDRAFAAAQVGARRTLSLAALSSLFLAAGLALTVLAARRTAKLAAMRADFVSAVTHELKTPIAAIRTINETLVSGRSSPDSSREYARLAVNETKRLTRLIDNLLAYARITDVTEAYMFESVSVPELVRDSLKEFHSQLVAMGFSVDVSIPNDLPQIRVDRPSMLLAIANLIDNAIRYSTEAHTLSVVAHELNGTGTVVIEVTDAGIGIAEDEVGSVTRKFFRGKGATSGGTGLGLSISQRIVSDHGGRLSVRSVPDSGTTVSIRLPQVGVHDDETDTHR